MKAKRNDFPFLHWNGAHTMKNPHNSFTKPLHPQNTEPSQRWFNSEMKFELFGRTKARSITNKINIQRPEKPQDSRLLRNREFSVRRLEIGERLPPHPNPLPWG